jgi:hypothetical protein
MFSIEKDFFTVNFNISLKSECEKYKEEIESNIKLEWVDKFEIYGGIISGGGKSLTIKTDKLMQGSQTFTVNIFFKDYYTSYI